MNKKVKRHPKRLKLGKKYIIWYDYKHKMVCKFIKPTKCGYNFLNLDTNVCILNHHLYPSKRVIHNTGDYFWVNGNLKIEEYK